MVVLLINMIDTINMCGSDDSGAILYVIVSCNVSDKSNSYSKYVW